MKIQSAALAMALAIGLISGACSTSSNGSAGGSANSWVLADLEGGLFAGPSGKGIAGDPTQTATFITAGAEEQRHERIPARSTRARSPAAGAR